MSAPGLDIRLELDVSSAEETLRLLGGKGGNPLAAASLRGNLLAAATTALLTGRYLGREDLARDLGAVRDGHTPAEDPFGLVSARGIRGEMELLVRELRRRNFTRSVALTLEGLFPPGARTQVSFPVYAVVFGPPSITAFVCRVEWEDGVPRFGDRGEPTVVLNLARTARPAAGAEEMFRETLGVVCHEVFHAVFAAYQDSSPVWQAWFGKGRRGVEELMALVQNEGIAYALSLEQTHGAEPGPAWERRARESFKVLNAALLELEDPSTTPRRREALLRAANTSEFLQSYGAVAGMFMARRIERAGTRRAIARTIAEGPLGFWGEYLRCARAEPGLPLPAEPVMRRLDERP
ncbi:MAG: DUF5700 domain-containing putative Zn-dependent protease [Bacteroidota bacterium]